METLDMRTTVLERFIKIANKFPDRKAVTWLAGSNWQSIKYKDLKSSAARVATALTKSGLNYGEAVIIPSLRSPNLCSNLLGTLWAGGHYVFIDPNYPVERQKFICNEVDAQFGIIESGTSQLDHLKLNWLKAPFPNNSSTLPTIPTDKELPAYIMFTSGSTGTPKGVVIPHRGITRLVVDTDYINFSEDEVFLQLSTLSFDASTLEIWGPLLNGGTCVLHPENSIITLSAIANSIESQKVTTIFLTTSLYNEIISLNPEYLKNIKQLLTGGEKHSIYHIMKGLKALPKTSIYHVYGPTENTTFTTSYLIPHCLDEPVPSIPIGLPIPGTSCEIFNNKLNTISSPNIPGELIVFGAGLALGYLNHQKLTKEKFIDVVCSDGIKRKGYRTGDIVVKHPDGYFDYLHRLDNQVKIDGHRIEIGEIEFILNGLDTVSEARVIVRTGPNGQKRLVAYLVSKKDMQAKEFRCLLNKTLPHYMVPHVFIPMDSLPKNQNGKLDITRLPDPFLQKSAAEPQNRTNKQIIPGLWKDILGREVGKEDNFLEAGGTSLEALRLTTELEKNFNTKLSAVFVFEYPTIISQEAYFAEHSKSRGTQNYQTNTESNKHDLAIIGMACRMPGAKDTKEFWKNLLSGKETVSFFSDNELSSEIPDNEKRHSSYVKAKGIIEDYDKFDGNFFGISPIEADIMDPQQRMMLELSWHALENAGVPPGDTIYKTGVYLGMNWARYYQQYVLPNKEIIQRFGVLNSALANESDLLSTRVSYKLNLKGPSINVFTACSTGLVAIAQACQAIEQGQCEQAIAGGISISTPVKAGYLYQEGSMLSKDGHCRPFDEKAAGTTFNDGAGVVVIKRKDLAEQDGDRIYAVIKGYAVNNDGEQKASFTAPSINGQSEVYSAALKHAGVNPESIGFIETHGTATPLGDPIEVLALRKSYTIADTTTKTCALGSVKSNIGHAIHAAGVASLIKTTLALKHNKIPPTLFFQKPNPKLQLDETHFFVNSSVIPWPTPSPRRAAVTSLGVGGTNAHVILEEYTQQKSPQCQGTDNTNHIKTWPLLISAKNKTTLDRQINNYHQFFIDKDSEVSAIDASYTSIAGRKHFPFRCVVSGKNINGWTDQLADPVSIPTAKAFDLAEKKIGFMFSGQGAQRACMGKWLYDNNKNFRTIFNNGCDIINSKEGFDLRKLLFADPEKNEDILAVNQTKIAQPALFLIEYGLARLLIENGCNPDFLIGHSIGEFAAAALADVFTFEDAVALVARRGALMQSMPPGKMLVVRSPVDKINKFIGEHISLAAINAPGLTVLSGPETSILNVEKQLNAAKIATTTLQTSHAFHSHMMEPILEEFTNFVATMKMAAPTIPIYSTMTGQLLTSEEATAPDYWANELRQPVKFSAAVLSAIESNSDSALAFLEVGPGNTLSSLVNYHSLPENVISHATLPGFGIDAKSLSEIDHCVSMLWCKGFEIQWLSRFKDQQPSKISLPGYAFAPDRHWLAPVANQSTPSTTPYLNPTQQQISQSAQEVAMNPADHLSEIKDQLKSLLEDVTGYDLSEMTDDTEFGEVGLDSLLLTQIATAIDRKFDVGITFRSLVEDYTCLKDLSGFIADKVPAVVKPAAASTSPVESTGSTNMTNATFPIANIAASGSAVQDLIQQQLQIMQLQLQMLSGGTIQTITETAKAADNQMGQTVSDKDSSSDNPPIEPPVGKQTPGTRISKEIKEAPLSTAQRSWIIEVMDLYQNKFKSSKLLAQKHRRHLADPRTVSGFNPEWKEIIFPIVTNRSKGSKLWDIDGNELIDTSNGFGPIFFGHSPDFVTHAVKEQIDKGIETGPQSPLAGEVAELFCELTGNERCTFACTGSEAVIGALRLARTVTGRNKVIMFEGGYHGIYDEVLTRPGKNYQALPAAPGVPREATSNMIVLPWGNKESLDIINQHGSDLAAVLVESVQSRKPEFHDADYIKEIRRITADHGAALILDEVVTGFRVHPGGIQKLFNIKADLATYGKVVGGGYPIGIIGGKAKFMDALDGGYWQYGDSSIPEYGVTFFAGTFVRHPLSLAAAKAVLNKIKSEGMPLYDAMKSKTAAMALEAKDFIKLIQTEVKFEEFSSLFYISVPQSAHWGHLLFTLMTLDGIHTQQYRPNFLTTEHSDTDINKILSAFKSALSRLVAHGLIPGDQIAAKKFLSSTTQIPPGARLGKNAEGQPAYFIEDPENKGQFIEVGKP